MMGSIFNFGASEASEVNCLLGEKVSFPLFSGFFLSHTYLINVTPSVNTRALTGMFIGVPRASMLCYFCKFTA